MLSCRDMAHEATDMMEGRVTWKRRLALWWHLFLCVHCRRFIRHLKIQRRLSGLRPTPPADPATVKRVMDRVKDRVSKDSTE